MPLAPGQQLGHYKIQSLIGKGGMGEVYRATDTQLKRDVALKILPPQFSPDPERAARFEREAHVLASLNHPNIASIYGLEHIDGIRFLVLELVEGPTLADRLKSGPLDIPEALRVAAELAAALEVAHAKGVIHRDLKTVNIKVGADGKVKVLDFGLAKRFDRTAESAETLTMAGETGVGQILGTASYMSPEQAEGRPVDERSDIFSFGVVLYELLCGTRPFRGDTTVAILASILRDEPKAPRQLRPQIPADVERLVLHCLAKRPEDRCASATEVYRQLQACQRAPHRRTSVPKPVAIAAALLLLAGLGVAGTRWYMHRSRVRWAQTVALPEASRLMEHGRFLAALNLARQAEAYVPNAPELVSLKEHLAPASIETTPSGADIYVIDYADPQASDSKQWQHLGRTPLKTFPLPRESGYLRLRAVKDGYEADERAVSAFGGRTLRIRLRTREETPPGMVWTPPFPGAFLNLNMRFQLRAAQIPGAWLDKYEVSNRQFKEFVDAGGYQKREYWKQPFWKDGKPLSWEQAIAEFRDATGRPGPSTWEAGSYPDGKADFPVAGVSWYEAAAYAEFARKSLPDVYHWYNASGMYDLLSILPLSNFGGKGALRVGASMSLGPYGTYDMAGNVKEWTLNSSGEKRYLLGGGWDETNYEFTVMDAQSPFERGESFGFRCARYESPLTPDLTGPVPQTSRERTHDKPVDDEVFKVLESLYSYDKTDLKATVDSVSEEPHWRRENVSFQAAYGTERVIAHLYLPKNADPPYQAVIYYPNLTALFARNPEDVIHVFMEDIVKSGRALILPAYKGMLERGPTSLSTPSNQMRDLLIQGAKDLRRTVDYLETRSDINSGKLGYLGLSLGAVRAPIHLVVEPRFKTAVLLSSCAYEKLQPEVDPWNFAPRLRTPVLMLNGRNDFYCPVETAQLPLFRALGTPSQDKRHVVYDGSHVEFINRLEVVKEALDWLDRYLGSVPLKP